MSSTATFDICSRLSLITDEMSLVDCPRGKVHADS